jgi:hypothetical protein
LSVGYRLASITGPIVFQTSSGEVQATARPVAGRVAAVTLEITHARAGVLDEVRHLLLAEPDVQFVYPALVHGPSGQIVLPTDQILMKVRAGVDRGEVDRRLWPSLAILRSLEGVDDEYVLRLLDPRADDPMAVAAALTREPWVAWAEPDFLREYAR